MSLEQPVPTAPVAPPELPTSSEYPTPHPTTILQAEFRHDIANGRRFVDQHHESIRYVREWRKWLLWDRSGRWVVDDQTALERLAKRTADSIWRDVNKVLPNVDRQTSSTLTSFARYASSAAGIANTIKTARSDERISISHHDLDRDPFLLNVKDGTIDLRTGRIRPASRADLITKCAPVSFDEEADCPRWRLFMQEIMGNSDESAALVRFLRRLCGYWLTGSVREQVLPILYGTGKNGKSTFLNTIKALLGDDYSMKASAGLLLAKTTGEHSTELTELFGRRLVTSIEIEAGKRLNEALVKELTGGDAIRARRMREDTWEFDPTHKIVIAANHRPVIRGGDEGIWRRVKLIPFTVAISEDKRDRNLEDKLRAELPGILNWCLIGCLDWQRSGSLGEPNAVSAATAAYRDDSDELAGFFADCCTIDRTAKVAASLLYDHYKRWCEANGFQPDTIKTLNNKLDERGFGKHRTKSGNVRTGIGMRVTAYAEDAAVDAGKAA